MCVDKDLKIVSSPAYMHSGPIYEIHDSVQNMVKAVLDLIEFCVC